MRGSFRSNAWRAWVTAMHSNFVDRTMFMLASFGLLFLAMPILMIFPLSLDPRDIISFPPNGLSLKWYAQYLTSQPWIRSTLLSLGIAVGASLIATIAGTLAAIGLVLGKFPFKRAVSVLLISPLLLPVVVVAIAVYGVYAAFGLVGSPAALAIAHAVLGLPFVIINVASALTTVPKSLDEAAQSLGATPPVVILTVILPLIWRGVTAGAVFAFAISFDEVVIALFISGDTAITLPRRMFDGIFYELSPIIAAVSGCLVVFNTALAVIGISLSGRRRLG